MRQVRQEEARCTGTHVPARKLTQLALLFALAVVLMVLEGLIPPIPTLPPGVKLGLSNIVVMYCLFYLGRKEALVILLLKSLFVFLTRGVVASAMSLGGGLLAVLTMMGLLALKRWRPSYLLISVSAAVAHNGAQLLISSLLLGNLLVFYYMPLLLLSGVAMGVVTGTILRVLMPAMRRLQ